MSTDDRALSTFSFAGVPPWISPETFQQIRELFEGFACPANLRSDVAQIFAGCYDVAGIRFSEPPTVLDIGANCGAYTRWVMRRWPDSRVHAYEPNPEAYQIYERNLQFPKDAGGSVVYRLAAVGDKSERRRLRAGSHNIGECSFHDLGQQSEQSIEVDCVDARDLPNANVVKVDTEGCEIEILAQYLAGNRPPPALVSFEFHREADRVALDNLLLFNGYRLARGEIHNPALGVLNYVHKSVEEVRG